MTKLVEWLTVTGIFLAIWAALITGQVGIHLQDSQQKLVLFSPLIFLVLFGLYAVIIVLYRVYTFNNSTEAAKELQKEISEAKEDLKKKGIVFNN